jgi:hypothetical protein
MTRRLAPFVASGHLDLTEVHDMLMETALERGMCDSFGRADAASKWVTNTLAREVAR